MLTDLMASDKNYLDRVYHYPEAVELVKAVSAGTVEALEASGTGAASGPVPVRVKRAFGAQAVPSGQVSADLREKFYCMDKNGVVKVVMGFANWLINGALDSLDAALDFAKSVGNRVFKWDFKTGGKRGRVDINAPCSPWNHYAPWNWYGQANTLDLSWWSVTGGVALVLDLAKNYFKIAVQDAWTGTPFLAVTAEPPQGEPGRLHAYANPNYVNFAMEAYSADGYDGWTLVPGNHSVLGKLLNSGAAYTPVTDVLVPEIAEIQFTRYRFDFTSDDDPKRLVSWVNALDLSLAAANLLTNVGGVRKALRGGAGLSCVREIAKEAGSLSAVLQAAKKVTVDEDAGQLDQLGHFYGKVGVELLWSLTDVVEQAAYDPACNRILANFAAAIANSAAVAAGKASNPLGWGVAWANLVFDAANETLPTAIGYFSPDAGSATYYLDWDVADGHPYVSGMSRTLGPKAHFTYEWPVLSSLMSDEGALVLDASTTVPGDSDDLTYQWSVRRFDEIQGEGERWSPDLSELGLSIGDYFEVGLLVTDGNGLKDEFWATVELELGPFIQALECWTTDEGQVRMRADIWNPAHGLLNGMEGVEVQWYGKVGSPTKGFSELQGIKTDWRTTEVELASWSRWAEVRVGSERKTCLVRSQPPSRPPVGKTRQDTLASGGDGPEMVEIPAGSFVMGCLSHYKGPRGWCDEALPLRRVKLDKPFAASKYQVTFDEYDRFMQATGREVGTREETEAYDEGWGRGSRPVINVSWEHAKAYVDWLSSETGATYRLLSEAEWEYAARAGTRTLWSWGDEGGYEDDSGPYPANCDDCGNEWDGDRTAPVGSFAPNPWGLHDMHGNVWEWVEDCFNEDYEEAPSDGSAWTSGDCSRSVGRGGAFNNKLFDVRASVRGAGPRNRFSRLVGFRVARELAP